MKIENCQKIKSGLLVLAKIIAREEIKNYSIKIDNINIFPSMRGISNDNFIKNQDGIDFQNNNKIKEKAK